MRCVALDRISGKVPVAIRDDVEFLRANVYMALGRPADAASVLKRLQGAQSLTRIRSLQPRHRAAAGRSRARMRSRSSIAPDS